MFEIRFEETKDLDRAEKTLRAQARERSFYQSLGSGCFAQAFGSAEHTDRVVKITTRKDWGYLTFLEEMTKVRETARNPWAPRVHAVTVYMDANSDDFRMAVELERLHCPWFNRGEWTAGVKAGWEPVVKMLEEIKVHTCGRQYHRWVQENEDLMMMVEIIRRAAKKTNTYIDLHSGNFLSRPGKKLELVITDPLGFSGLQGGTLRTWERVH